MKKILLITLISLAMCGIGWAQEQSSGSGQSMVTLATKVNFTDFKMQMSICTTPRFPYVGVKLKYWEPTLMVETVKNPGDYVIQDFYSTITNMIKNVPTEELRAETKVSDLNVTGGNAYQEIGSSNLKFNEVHVYDFPLHLVLQTVLCPSVVNSTLGVRYLTELDATGWRKSDWEKALPQTKLAADICLRAPLTATGVCLGNWGPLFPRTGFLIHSSDLVASAVDALRAVSASDLLSLHVVVARLDFSPDLSHDKIQLVYPTRSPTFNIGDPTIRLYDQSSKDGRYVWVYWHYRECCKTVTG